jgi:hypothetical protein
MPNNSASTVTEPVRDLLERTGVRVVRNRADCPKCEGTSRLTMSVNEDWAFCHRCRYTVQRRRLQPIQETPEERAEHARAREFVAWKNATCRLVADELIRLTMVAESAKRALALRPNDEGAWEELRQFSDAEPYMMGALDHLSCEKVSRWLEYPATEEQLRAAFDRARARAGRAQ